MQKPSQKVQKIILLLATWVVLLGFFFAYEHYFVDGQREYLIDTEFWNLNRLSTQLNAQFARATLSVNSLAKIVQELDQKSSVSPLATLLTAIAGLTSRFKRPSPAAAEDAGTGTSVTGAFGAFAIELARKRQDRC